MKNLKKFFLFVFIAIQILAIFGLWGTAIYSAFTHKPISDYIDWQWWVFFFTLDLWTAKFFAEKNKQVKEYTDSQN